MKLQIRRFLKFIWGYKYVFLFCFSLFIIDVGVRYPHRKISVLPYLAASPLLFTMSIILILLAIYLLIPNKKVKIGYAITLLTIFNVLLIVQTIYMSHFGLNFTFKNLLLAKEGLTYAGEYLHAINIKIILIFIFSIISMILAILSTKKHKLDKFIAIGLIVLATIGIFIGYKKLGQASSVESQAFSRTIKDYFNDYTQTSNSMSVSGIYMYTFKDFYHTFLEKKEIDNKKADKVIEKYLDKYSNISKENEYTGMFKDKNVIYVMMEDIDTWMIKKETMPNLSKLMNTGINFDNHYSTIYATGNTFVTEMVSNTGFMPKFYDTAPAYNYASNSWPYALPNLFKNSKYTTNSVHVAAGNYYNRFNNQKNWGYETYSNFTSLGISQEHYSQDRYLVEDGYEKLVRNEKFMTYIITYSAHMPFNKEKPECKENLSAIKKSINSTDDNYLCALSQAHETDLFIGKLIDALKKDNKLDNTVLVLYSDHYSYSYEYRDMVANEKQEGDDNLLQRTPFVIWNNNIEHINVEEVTSTIDIVPTISNLFDLDYNPKYYIGRDIFNKKENGLAFFNDYSWYDGNNYYKAGKLVKGSAGKKYISDTNSLIKDKIDYNNNVILSNYFARK